MHINIIDDKATKLDGLKIYIKCIKYSLKTQIL